ncbi:acetate kinase [Desulfopila sp. IMCC35008]|uniref:acetate kinase n=1 Tax=Desulfopila sp. IMCC35008 TaxID=2653858 RepID=UPI0013D1A1E1|nr:acetate kinase [Desulfopila sp. IMCC35008]
MKILVVNCGSSSIKYKLFDVTQRKVLASGLAERIGEPDSILTHKHMTVGEEKKQVEKNRFADHLEGLQRIVDLLLDPENGTVSSRSEISAVGHRVVHGGDTFHQPTLIDDQVIADIEACIPLAPLHNPANLMGIQVARKLFPNALQVAVFDTAFHQTLPVEAHLYAIPFELHQKYKIRRYGFHGTSHAFVSEEVAVHLKRPLTELNLITLHLGNGASMAAVAGGRCIDTTMGLTPLAGLVMGTRSGDIDPSVLLFLAKHENLSAEDLDDLLNKRSGLQGLCGVNDMREVIAKAEAGDQQAETAMAVFSYRIKQYIGAYTASLGRVDALVFTAGIGENAPLVRERACQGLEGLGIEIDRQKNRQRAEGIMEVSTVGSRVKVLVVPTNEELRIAQETLRAAEKKTG